MVSKSLKKFLFFISFFYICINSKTLVANSVNVNLGQGVNVAKATQITIIGNDTGATTSITVTNNVTLASLALGS